MITYLDYDDEYCPGFPGNGPLLLEGRYHRLRL